MLFECSIGVYHIVLFPMRSKSHLSVLVSYIFELVAIVIAVFLIIYYRFQVWTLNGDCRPWWRNLDSCTHLPCVLCCFLIVMFYDIFSVRLIYFFLDYILMLISYICGDAYEICISYINCWLECNYDNIAYDLSTTNISLYVICDFYYHYYYHSCNIKYIGWFLLHLQGRLSFSFQISWVTYFFLCACLSYPPGSIRLGLCILFVDLCVYWWCLYLEVPEAFRSSHLGYV